MHLSPHHILRNCASVHIPSHALHHQPVPMNTAHGFQSRSFRFQPLALLEERKEEDGECWRIRECERTSLRSEKHQSTALQLLLCQSRLQVCLEGSHQKTSPTSLEGQCLSQGFYTCTKHHDQEAIWGRKGLLSLNFHTVVHH